MSKARVIVLISGSGSNLQAIIDSTLKPDSAAEVVAVFSNRPNVKGLERAQKYGIDTHTLDHTEFEDRAAFDTALSAQIDDYSPELVVLAGFMRILTPAFVQHFLGRMLNIHPSLLPKYPGLHTHQRAIEAGDSHHGTTVHFVTPELDGGPAIIQAEVPILSDDNADTLALRVLTQEHIIYPMAVQWFSKGDLCLKGEKAWLDGKPIEDSGYKLK